MCIASEGKKWLVLFVIYTKSLACDEVTKWVIKCVSCKMSDKFEKGLGGGCNKVTALIEKLRLL
jgi:hypothetical protein